MLLSPNGLVTFTSTTLSELTIPANTGSPVAMLRGLLFSGERSSVEGCT